MRAKCGAKRTTLRKWQVESDPMRLAVRALLDDLESERRVEQDSLQPAADSIDDFMARRFRRTNERET